MHLFVTGEVGVGKTTLINHLLHQVPKEKIYGFCTQKHSPDGKLGEAGKVYIFPAKQNGKVHSLENEAAETMHCVAEILGKGQFNLHREVFEEYGVSLLENIPDGSLVVMDELGFLESRAPKFCEKVKALLNREVTVIGVIKAKHTPFLDEVRNHSAVEVYTLTEENRDALTIALEKRFKEERYGRNITGKNV